MTSFAAQTPLSPLRWPRFGLTDRRLDTFAWILLAAMIPAAIALLLDDRELRGVNVWVKPMKFMASGALVALTTSWLARHLPEAVRAGRSYRALVWTLIATTTFEVTYISLQAALGQGSHYNVTDVFHIVMFSLMGIGAIALTATQPWLAWLIWRHGDTANLPRAYLHAVMLGLVLTFVLGASVGVMLGNLQPAGGPGLPVVGWSRVGGDLRVAHFLGIHAEQILPLAGLLLAVWAARAPGPRSPIAHAGVWALALGLTAVWGATVFQALQGRPLLPL
jgi:hypothetical protein